jgi:hypothetical protein
MSRSLSPQIGCCGIVLHPRWNRNAYPCTVFTLATKEQLLQVFHSASTPPTWLLLANAVSNDDDDDDDDDNDDDDDASCIAFVK